MAVLCEGSRRFYAAARRARAAANPCAAPHFRTVCARCGRARARATLRAAPLVALARSLPAVYARLLRRCRSCSAAPLVLAVACARCRTRRLAPRPGRRRSAQPAHAGRRDALSRGAGEDRQRRSRRAAAESDAALEDMEDVMAACMKQKGCSVHDHARRLQAPAEAQRGSPQAEVRRGRRRRRTTTPTRSPPTCPRPRAPRALLSADDQRFDKMVQYNPAVQAGIRRWLTDMRGR